MTNKKVYNRFKEKNLLKREETAEISGPNDQCPTCGNFFKKIVNRLERCDICTKKKKTWDMFATLEEVVLPIFERLRILTKVQKWDIRSWIDRETDYYGIYDDIYEDCDGIPTRIYR